MTNYIDQSLAEKMKNGTAEQKVDALFNYMEAQGQSFYDEVVTQLEHALQCAALAQQNNAGPTLITSALLHDLGHFILDEHNADKAFLATDLNHEEIGARYLAPFFPEAVTTPIRLHVPAKRYLCATDASYHDGLSEASKRSLKVQGGVMSGEEQEAFEQISHSQDALTLRRWDDLAKVKGLETVKLETYRTIVQQCLKDR
ncbi:HD family phosphohydrolase [Candidatus Poribacteria bacterium]|nr:HD family phosphohydrolase [Candidatus Poribacteria bacterium]MYG06652.1 HD family phosphohydrolase [Candidatus Poribacteria bacterium]MYK22590.1 HD family phosphohydrolase [Candidatus Poribacteria bacterium]